MYYANMFKTLDYFIKKIKYFKLNFKFKKYLRVYKFKIFVLDLFSLDNDSLVYRNFGQFFDYKMILIALIIIIF